ncbi:MAG: pentapeptide repeat-containing protein [Alphaproteobacteria bacterium]|nr:pentapeptide repeat-containing protein [Alphaproteobacteria bacterium]
MAVARRAHDQRAAANVDERMLGGLVVVERIAGRVLGVPLDESVVRIQRQHRGDVEIVAGTILLVVVGTGVAGAPVGEVEPRIERAGLPDRAAPGLPCLVGVEPGGFGLLVGIAVVASGRVRAPYLLAGVELGGVERAADAVLGPCRADDGEVANDQGRHGERLGDRRVVDLAFPQQLARLLVDAMHAPVERDRDDAVPPQRDSAVVDAAAGDVARPHLVDLRIVLPHEVGAIAAAHVDLVDRAPAVRDVEEPILGDRRALEPRRRIAAALRRHLTAEQPHHLGRQVLDVGAVDLAQVGKAMGRIIAVDHRPVLRLGVGVLQPRLSHVAGHGRRREGKQGRRGHRSGYRRTTTMGIHGTLSYTRSWMARHLPTLAWTLAWLLVAGAAAQVPAPAVGEKEAAFLTGRSNDCPACALEGADLQRRELKGANLERAVLGAANLYLANLEGANLKGADLEGANLSRSNLRGADLSDATISYANLYLADGTGAKFNGTYAVEAILIRMRLQRATFENAKLIDSDFRNASVGGAVFRNAYLGGSRFDQVNLGRLDMRGANLEVADLPFATMRGTNLEGVNLKEADLYGADLTDANLKAANLTNARLLGATAIGTNFEGAIIAGTILPGGEQAPGGEPLPPAP